MMAHSAQAAPSQSRKPNIPVIWGDDIGQFNVRAWRGMSFSPAMAFRFPCRRYSKTS
ncbi:hypothetical protein [Methylocystis heyeri]|uniref:hypothetical protein n=1 Tax=Methylocystis heyeri TaxID=391905 RepID=UPI001FEA9412|nr:hypothetical protein [Methylocystis heyeri]